MKNFSTLMAIVLILAMILVATLYNKKEMTPVVEQPADTKQSAEVIRSQVTAFGATLKLVSLLQPKEELNMQMKQHYGPYVTEALLAQWQNTPESALGRTVSSPWPERIEIAATEQFGDTYIVEGNVVEVTSTQTAGVYPVTLTLTEEAGVWKISSAIKGPYSEIPQEMTLVGAWVCLPHKNSGEIQTMECAFGIKEEKTGKYYAVSMNSGTPENITMQSRVRVTGTMVPKNQLSTNIWNIYDIVGIIGATKVEKL